MKNGILIYSKSNTAFTGVEKKISNQLKVLSKRFIVNCVGVEKEKTNIIKSVCWRLPFGSWGANYKKTLNQIKDFSSEAQIDFFYLRAPVFDRKYIHFIYELRKEYEQSIIIMEIPTYPYYKELLFSKTMWPWFFKDLYYTRYIKKYINRICTFSNDEYIHNVRTIKTCNGICVDDISINTNLVKKKERNIINLLAVAQFQKSHGYERIIKGLRKYYKDNKTKKRVTLHMVGYGEELPYYKRLVTKYELHDYVIFYGKKTGKELDEIYNIADIGMGCFGLYKRNIKTISSLKVGEYLARGIPVVSGVHEKAFEKEPCDYYIEFPNDNSEVSIDEIVSFYERLYETEEKLQNKIREYAKRNVDMSVTMKPVIDYIENEEG